jgi:uncharacterized protein (TIGR02453 family)
MKNIFIFLEKLKKNNNRDWFLKNKQEYESCRKEFEEFISILSFEIYKFDKSIDIENPSQFIFRIYKDIRFSKDKSPYKTNFGAHISKSSKLSDFSSSGYYIHLEPGNSMLGGGIYMPSSPVLNQIREKIIKRGDEFHKIIINKNFKKVFNLDKDLILKKSPKGFDPNHKYTEYLKLKSFTAIHNMSDSEVLERSFIKETIKKLKLLKEFSEFLNSK